LNPHDRIIREQFTKQAEAFSTAPGITDRAALQLLVEFSGAGSDDVVLDVACGPGLVVGAFARVVREATGIDLTPAMIERARALAAGEGLANAKFVEGNVLPLPFAAESFSIVASRYAFHHFPEPKAVFDESLRVLRPGGCLLLADVFVSGDRAKAEAYNRMEKLRDPSHARAMPLEELQGLFTRAGLPAPREAFYNLEIDLEGLLSRSCPDPGSAEKIRRMFEDSLASDGLGMATRREGGEIHAHYPITVLAARKPGAGR